MSKIKNIDEIINHMDWFDQISDFEEEFKIQGKKVWFQCSSRYNRAPHWSVGTDIDMYFEGEAGKGIFNHLELPGEDEKPYQNKVVELILKIHTYLNNLEEVPIDLEQIDRDMIDCKNPAFHEFLLKLKEGLIGATQSEKEAYHKEIEEHNKRCEEFHKKNPYYYIELLLKPGLASVLSDN